MLNFNVYGEKMKVLILSHNPITTYQNMGKTLLSLFSSFNISELCQLYIYPTIPDIEKCNSYYRITDRDVFKSYARFGKVKSRVIQNNEININKHSLFETENDEAFLTKTKNKKLCKKNTTHLKINYKLIIQIH